MTKRVRVMRNLMPIAENSSIFNMHYLQDFFTQKYIDILFEKKSIEWVEEEKSLEEELVSDFNKQSNYVTHEQRAIKASVIAKEHYQKKFDEALNNCHCMKEMKSGDTLWDIKPIRKAMFGEQE